MVCITHASLCLLYDFHPLRCTLLFGKDCARKRYNDAFKHVYIKIFEKKFSLNEGYFFDEEHIDELGYRRATLEEGTLCLLVQEGGGKLFKVAMSGCTCEAQNKRLLF